MRAVDTNILARFYLRDDATQGRIAADVLTAGDVFIPKTVVLEHLDDLARDRQAHQLAPALTRAAAMAACPSARPPSLGGTCRCV